MHPLIDGREVALHRRTGGKAYGHETPHTSFYP